MRCTKCRSDNRDGRKFCASCGAALSSACSRCGFVNEPGERFCGGCSAAIAPVQAAPAGGSQGAVPDAPAFTETPETPESAAERRQLTVLFSDLVGSTALSARLDPEDLRDVIRSYERHCTDVVARYGGVAAYLMGDGVLAFFGYPLAHEDDAQRALHAGLEIVASTPLLQVGNGVALATRVGVATGLVVIGEVIATEVSHQYAVSGEAPNLAARLQSLAEPNQVLVSETTRRLAGGTFIYHDHGLHALKGFSEPVRLWHVLGASGAETRFDAAQSGMATALVGREHERGLLQDRWEQAKEGEGQVVLLSGEAGIGKSRMVQALYESVRGESLYRLRYQCLAYYANSALYAVTRQIEHAAGITQDLDDAQRLQRLERLLAEATPSPAEVLPLFAALLGIAGAAHHPHLELPAPKLKERTLLAIAEQLRGLAARKPVLFVLEDAHWIDPTTLELLEILIGRLANQRVLMVVTFRPEFEPPWVRYSHVTQLALNRLSRRHCNLIVAEITRGKPLPEDLLAQMLVRTDGIPLFVEEQTKMVLESGLLREENGSYVLARELPDLAIPSSLQDSLMARLDRLEGAKELAQVCAVIGRELPYELIAAVTAMEEKALSGALERLIASGLFLKVAGEGRSLYSFKHALIQDAAYGSMLRTRRQKLHLTVARVLEERFPERVANEPELIAFHYSEGGQAKAAFSHWRLAGQRAVSRGVMREAIAHYGHALDALAAWPDDATRQSSELETLISLGVPLIAVRGYADPQVHHTYLRASQLATELEDRAQLFAALWGVWTCYRARLEMQQARELAARLNELARALGDTSRLLAAHHAQWTTYTYLGDLATATLHCQEGMRLYRPDEHHEHVFTYGGHDPGCCGIATAALVLCLVGRTTEALRHIEDARKLSDRLGHPPTLAHALTYSALLSHFLRDAQATLEYAQRTLEIAQRVELPGYAAAATMLAAWARSAMGQVAGSVTEIRRCTTNNLFMVAGVTRPYFLAMLAEAQVDVGDFDAALDTLEGAVDEVQQHQMRFWEPELYRMRGSVLERKVQPDLERAAKCYRRSIDTAHEQGARLLELRACTSLARLLGTGPGCVEARERLATLLDVFSGEPVVGDVLEARRAMSVG